MTNLEKALILSKQATNEKEANQIVKSMLDRINNYDEDAEEILSEYNLEPDFVEDILDWTPLPVVDETKMMFKIKALMDKANSTDSQAEKDSFMLKAQELIQKHNIDSSRIVAMEGETINGIREEAIIEERVKYEEDWDRMLFENILENNLCRAIYGAKHTKLIYIIGKESNVNSVIFLAGFYRKAILNLATEDCRRKKIRDMQMDRELGVKSKPMNEERYIENYLFGAVEGLNDALKGKSELFIKETFKMDDGAIVKGGDVVRINKDRIAEFIKKKYPNLGRVSFSGGGNSSSSAFQRGNADGRGLGSGQRRIG